MLCFAPVAELASSCCLRLQRGVHPWMEGERQQKIQVNGVFCGLVQGAGLKWHRVTVKLRQTFYVGSELN